MKYIRKYNESDDNFDFIASEFDKVIEIFADISDEENVNFSTNSGLIDGQNRHTPYINKQDYLDKNQKYINFIESLPMIKMQVSVYIYIDKNYNDTLSLMDDLNTHIDRMADISWDLHMVNLEHTSKKGSLIDIEFSMKNI